MADPVSENKPGTCSEVFGAFLRLGLTSFGGPVAHLGFFHKEFVVRRRWLDEGTFADLVALCQFLPGPASSQVGMALGLRRAGLPGLLAAFLGFTLPSAVLMIGFAYGIGLLDDVSQAGWLRGLKLAAVAVVAQAVWTMATRLCPDRPRITLALTVAIAVLAWPNATGQIAVILTGALWGWRFYREPETLVRSDAEPEGTRTPRSHEDATAGFVQPLSRSLGAGSLVAFVVLLLALPAMMVTPGLREFGGFFRVGSLVFGGGHVVLPLLQAETVEKGWITADRFVAGYGAAQAMPGPLFSFAGFLGAGLRPPLPHGWIGGLLGLTAIFLPSVLLLVGVLPFWEALRRLPGAQAALRGANAAVVGVLLAALYQPVWTSAVHNPRDLTVALAAYGLLVFWRCPSWLVVMLAAGGGSVLLG